MAGVKQKWLDRIKALPEYARRPWYPYALFGLAFADYFILVVPLDPLVVGSFLAARDRWLRFSFFTSLGSTLGACALAEVLRVAGTGILNRWMPGLLASPEVLHLSSWLDQYGLLALIGASILPIHQHPTVAVAALARVPLPKIFLGLFLGRFLKYCLFQVLLRTAHRGFERWFRN